MKFTQDDITRIIARLKAQTRIRFSINHAAGFGDQVSAMHTISRLRQLGVTATIEIIYDNFAAENIATLLGYGAEFSSSSPFEDVERNIILISSDHFSKHYQQFPWHNLGFQAATGQSSLNLALLTKTSRFLQTNPFLDTADETNKIFWGKGSVPHSFPLGLNNASILYPVTTRAEAKVFMQSPAASTLRSTKPGLPSVFDHTEKRFTVSLYGMNVVFEVNPVQVINNFVQAIAQLGMPAMLLVHNKLAESELQQIAAFAKNTTGHIKYLDVRNATEFKTLDDCPQQILIINVGSTPYQVFDALMASSHLALQEGANSKSLALNVELPTIHCASGPEGWTYVLPHANKFDSRVANQLRETETAVCGNKNKDSSAVRVLRNYISDLRDPKSLLARFFDDLFRYHNDPRRDRLLLMLNHTFSVDLSSSNPAAAGKDYTDFIEAIDQDDVTKLAELSGRFNPLLAPDMFQNPPATHAVSTGKMGLAANLYLPYLQSPYQALPLPPQHVPSTVAMCTSQARIYHPDPNSPYAQTLANRCFDSLFTDASQAIRAVVTGNTQDLASALASNPTDVNSYHNGHSLMGFALYFNQAESIQALVRHGLSVGPTELSNAAASMNPATFKLAMQHFKDKWNTGIQWNSLVSTAIRNNNERLVRSLARLPLPTTEKQAAFKGSVPTAIASGFDISTIKMLIQIVRPPCDEELQENLFYYFSRALYDLFPECRHDFISEFGDDEAYGRIGGIKLYAILLMNEDQAKFNDFLPLVTDKICKDLATSRLCGELLPSIYYGYPDSRLAPLAAQCGQTPYQILQRCNQQASIDSSILRTLKFQDQLSDFFNGSLQSISFGFLFHFLTTCVDSATNSKIITQLLQLVMLIVMLFSVNSILEQSFLLMSLPLGASGAGDMTFGVLHVLMNVMLAMFNDDFEYNDIGVVAASSGAQFVLGTLARPAGRKAGSLVMGLFSSESGSKECTEENAKNTKKHR